MTKMNVDMADSLSGISGILVTPYGADGEIAPDLLHPVVDRAVDAGVHVLTANGNTGEYYGLSADEAERMVYAAAEIIDGRVPLVGGVGRSIKEACALAKASADAGASALMVHQPPDPFVSPRGLHEYIQRVADAGQGTPLVLYLRNDLIGTEAISKICAIDGVLGVKWATPNPMKLSAAIAASPEHIIWVGGLAEVWAPALYAVGARGFTSGLINVWPERSVAIHTALEKQDYILANDLIDEMRVFEDIRAEEMGGTNVTGVKTALAMIGSDCGSARPPSAWPLTENQSQRLEDFLTNVGLVKGTV